MHRLCLHECIKAKLRFSPLALIGFWLLLGCNPESDSKSSPNIIYISVEDMPPIWGVYGHQEVHTPNLDRLAGEMVLFKDMHCQVALCTPSRTSLLTGLRPSTTGMVKIDDHWKEIVPGARSLPRHFRDHGYLTYGIGKIADPRSGGLDSAWTVQKEPWGVTGNELALQAIDSLAELNSPFFLAVGYKQTHDPWDPAPRFLTLYDTAEIQIPGTGHVYKKDTLHDAEIKVLLKDFYAELSEVDSLVGELARHLKGLGLFDKSITMIGAMDHGYSLGIHDKWGKGNNYDNETMVPFMMRLPGRMARSEIEGITELVDLYPTLIDICGLPLPPQELEGISWTPLFRESGLQGKPAAITHRAYAVESIGVKTETHNLIRNADGTYELYQRQEDPLNLNNILEEEPLIAGRLKMVMERGWSALQRWE